MMLAALQRDMRAWLIREDEAAAARFGERAAPGLRAYQNNYRAQLAACLEESFGLTLQWIGGAAFHEAVVAHVERLPPSSWTLDAYARDFPATLAMRYPADPEVIELSWLELALGEAFVGPDARALDSEALAGIDWDQAVIRFVPTLDVGELTTNAPAIWSALSAGEAPPAPEALSEAGALIVWRAGQYPRFRAIDQIERQALMQMRGGLGFGDLCGSLVEMLGHEDGIARAGRLLGQWIADGMLVAID